MSSKVINSGAYLGTRRDDWTPEGEKFALGYKQKVMVFNYAATSFFLNRAKSFVTSTIQSGGRGFFFGLILPQSGFNPSIAKLSRLGQVVTTGNWRGGYITNTRSLRVRLANGTKKFCFVASFRFDHSSFPVIFEAIRIRLPLIAPVDSNSNPSYFTYPIPGNSSGSGVLGLLAKELTSSVFSGVFHRYLKPGVLRKKRRNLKYNKYNKHNKYRRRYSYRRFNNRNRSRFIDKRRKSVFGVIPY